MKQLYLTFALFILITAAGNGQTKNTRICRPGFTYEISKSTNWGNGLPVVQSVYPYSSAESAGMRAGDLIETIDGIPAANVQPEEISQLLNRAGSNELVLGIRNLANPLREIIIRKECKRKEAITEEQLAVAYSLYSPESTYERQFTCPFAYTVQPGVNYADFKTYAFTMPDPDNEALENALNECIAKELNGKGLKETSENPDMLVQTFYFFDKNPAYRGENKIRVKKEPVYRYNSLTRQMEVFPFLPVSSSASEAEYVLQLGFRFIDRRNPDKNKLQVVWECEANEKLGTPYKLQEYAKIFVPLLCMNYPYVKTARNPKYVVNYETYNYTGIRYDMGRLEQVVAVDRNSPAQAAGIRSRDLIESIDGHSLDHTAAEFAEAYKRFVAETMPYRDPATQFTDANGFRYAMLWDKFQYPKIADALQEKKYLPAFSYLYYFAPYVNPEGVNACRFTVKRGKNTTETVIRPVIRNSVTIQIQ